jgi:SAM-dependent methyltransferase
VNKNRVWQDHEGQVLASESGFDVIDCLGCGFKHIVSIPTEEELETAYQHDYYSQEKPLYLERYREDLEWWNMVYDERYQILEQFLPKNQRRLLEIGSGPGFFLLNGQKRGWEVKGIEPSVQAVKHSLELGVEVVNDFFSKVTAPKLGKFDAVNMSEVLEHLPNPAALLHLVFEQLNEGGVICIVVPNDFNPIQLALRDHLGFKPWWVAPPHHINYFDFDSLQKLVERCGFDVVHKEATFPIDMFLLMGDNYIGNDALGRECHSKRKTLEMNFNKTGMIDIKRKLYQSFSEAGLGREVVIYAKKL